MAKRKPSIRPGIAKQEYELVPLAAIQPHPRNVNEGDVGAIVESIKANQFFGACLVQRSSSNILAGKHRWLAAKECGLEMIPVIWADVDDKTALRMVLADNRTCRLGNDDPLKLSELLQEILADAGTLAGTGFSTDDLDEILADLNLNEPTPEPEPTFQSDKIHAGSVGDLLPSPEERAVLSGRKLLVEYSGGKDSTAAAIWARHYFPDNETELLFVDMAADFVGFHLYLFDTARFLGVPLRILRSEQTVIDAMLAKGEWPNPLHPYCHNNLHQPLDDYMRKHDPASIAILRGGRLSERAATGKKNASRFLTVDRMKEYAYFQPLYFSDKETSVRLLEQAECPIWDGYSRGLCRTACRICPGQKPRAYAAIRANYPEVWQELLDLERRFGPGGWSDPANEHSARFEESANRGQKDFEHDTTTSDEQ